ncbi:MAG: DPP IV N-terminal domain-containing protein [Bacteroidota bacterium]
MSARLLGGLVLLLVLLPTTANGQSGNFDLAERFTTQRMDTMVGSLSVNAQWLEDENRFWYEYETSEGRNWVLVDADRRSRERLFDQEEMAGLLAEALNKPFNGKDLPLKAFEYDQDGGVFTFHVDSIQFQYRLEDRQLIQGDSVETEPDAEWATFSPDSSWIAFARQHNLFLMRTDDPDSTEYQLTQDGERWYSYQDDDGDTTSTKRLEADVTWFKDSAKLYVRRQDRRQVDDLWVIDSRGERPSLETYKYPMPGEEHVPQDEIWIFAADTAATGVRVQADKWKDQALGGAYFNRGGFYMTERSDHLYFLRRDRTWKHIDVCRANTETGAVEVLWSETSKPYFNTRFADLAILNEGEAFIWWSERNGWGQLYRYDADGSLMNKITDGFYTVGDIEQIDTTGQVIYFEAYGAEEGRHPYHAYKYSVRFDGSQQRLLTPEPATHSFSMNDAATYFVDTYSRVDQAPRSVLRDRTGAVVMELEETDIDPLVEAGWTPPTSFTVKAADGHTDLYGVLWKPHDFDSTRTYPIISYVYPGPQVEPFPVNFVVTGSRARPSSLAQVGFIVVAFGQRGGSPLRSKYYHNYGYGNLRDYPLADNKYGLEQLAARHAFIDLNRVGIYGHSGGGFMSTAALLTYPDFYDVAVSSAGNHDNNVYNMWWSEVHHGVDQKTRRTEQQTQTEQEVVSDAAEADSTGMTEEVYFESRIPTNAELAENLKGHLLLVHGDIDSNVHPANTMRLVDALIDAGKRFDFMLLPGQRHGFGPRTPYFERMMWYYFAEHLLDDYRPDTEFVLPEDN